MTFKPSVVGSSMSGGLDSFLRCQEVKDLELTTVLEMSDLEARQAFTTIRFSESHGVPECPPCGSSRIYPLRDGEKWRCSFCAKDFSLTSGTIFASRKLPYRAYLSGLALMMNGPKGINITQIGERLGLTYRTIYQLAVDLRNALQETSNNIPADVLERPKYQGGSLLSTFTRWSREDTAKLVALCKGDKEIGTASSVLGREEKTVARRAMDLGLVLPSAWRLVLPRAAYHPRKKTILLQYPYIIKPRDEHADLLAVNSLIPKGIPSESRADIVQEIMLALLEGKITLDEVKANKESLRAFIRSFYKQNYQPNAISLSGYADDEREYYDIASGISRDQFATDQMRDLRSSFDAITHTYQPAIQLEQTYHKEIYNHMRKSHEDGKNISFDEAIAEVESEDFTPINRIGSGVSPLATADILARAMKSNGLSIRTKRSPTGSFYIFAHYMIVRISDHPNREAAHIVQDGGAHNKLPAYEWRTDLNAGFHFKTMKYQTLKELADDFLLDCEDAGFHSDEERAAA